MDHFLSKASESVAPVLHPSVALHINRMHCADILCYSDTNQRQNLIWTQIFNRILHSTVNCYPITIFNGEKKLLAIAILLLENVLL